MLGPDFYTFRELWRQYRNCRRNKRNTLNALAFEMDAEANLVALQRELRSHTYRPGRSVCFITRGPKPREVFAADFRDRVVHHLLVSHQEPVFEPFFIHDSFACRKGKGTLAASDRLMELLRRVTANGRRRAWALKLDVASFFASIHKQTLYRLIAERMRHPELLWLTRTVLFHDPTTDYRFRSGAMRSCTRPGPQFEDPGTGHCVAPGGSHAPGPTSVPYPVPAQKSLFGKQNERGLPIGNLTSQFWANVYLNELDHFVKRRLRCRYYVRYVDDMVLLSTDPGELERMRDGIRGFLRDELRLKLRVEHEEPEPVSRGIDFVGWKTWWNRRLPRRRTLGSFRTRLEAFERAVVRGVDGEAACRIDLHGVRAVARIERLRAAVASYSGHLRHGQSWRQWVKAWNDYPWLGMLFSRRGWQVEERWPARRIARTRRFQEQHWLLVCRVGLECLVFCQVGRFVEFRGPQRQLAERVLRLRTSYLPRAGYALAAGFPVRLHRYYQARALDEGMAVAVVRETGSRVAGCKCRRVVEVVLPEAGRLKAEAR